MSDDLPKIGTTPEDLVKNTPQMPKAEPKKVDLPDLPDWKADVSLNLWENLGRFWRAVSPSIGKAIQLVSDVEKITAFFSTWWIPLSILLLALILFLLLR